MKQAFLQIKQEFDVGQTNGPEFRVAVEGRPRELHPLFQDEVYRIGREALVNAFRHADAKDIEVALEYSHRGFKLSVRDDGSGIDPHVLETGRAEHWGLVGMRERTERTGAHLRVLTRPRGGTQVEMSAPGRIAFRAAPEGSRALASGLALQRGIFRFLRSITKMS